MLQVYQFWVSVTHVPIRYHSFWNHGASGAETRGTSKRLSLHTSRSSLRPSLAPISCVILASRSNSSGSRTQRGQHQRKTAVVRANALSVPNSARPSHDSPNCGSACGVGCGQNHSRSKPPSKPAGRSAKKTTCFTQQKRKLPLAGMYRCA